MSNEIDREAMDGVFEEQNDSSHHTAQIRIPRPEDNEPTQVPLAEPGSPSDGEDTPTSPGIEVASLETRPLAEPRAPTSNPEIARIQIMVEPSRAQFRSSSDPQISERLQLEPPTPVPPPLYVDDGASPKTPRGSLKPVVLTALVLVGVIGLGLSQMGTDPSPSTASLPPIPALAPLDEVLTAVPQVTAEEPLTVERVAPEAPAPEVTSPDAEAAAREAADKTQADADAEAAAKEAAEKAQAQAAAQQAADKEAAEKAQAQAQADAKAAAQQAADKEAADKADARRKTDEPRSPSARTLSFKYDESAPLVVSDTQMKALVAQLKRADARIVLTGHTCDRGDPDYNVHLGYERARAVRELLVENGLPKWRIQVESAGDTQPLSSNETATGRRKNRRVEVRIE
jgi:outer membrane protein OmpA-like peptidoglycan-associated protein